MMSQGSVVLNDAWVSPQLMCQALGQMRTKKITVRRAGAWRSSEAAGFFFLDCLEFVHLIGISCVDDVSIPVHGIVKLV